MTFISFPNISATSDDGQFRIEIVGAPADDFFRDQSDFTYRLFHLNQCVWEWLPGRETSEDFLADFPHEAWVNNDGWVVVRSHEWFHGGLLVLSPTGQLVLQQIHRSFDDKSAPGFLDGEPEDYMGDTSAGPFWSRSSLPYFFEQNGHPFWTIRTWWGRRVVIDLSQGKFIDPSQLDENLVRRLETSIIKKVLNENLKHLEEPRDQLLTEEQETELWALVWPVMTAAYHAGWLQYADCIPELRRLERLKSIGASSYGHDFGAVIYRFQHVRIAKTTLLRLGQEPQWQPSYEFERDKSSNNECSNDVKTFFQVPNVATDRDMEALTVGMTLEEALLCIGTPDFVTRHYWEYDFLNPQGGQTVRVTWDDSLHENIPPIATTSVEHERSYRIAKIEIMKPQWQQITLRDHFM